MKGRKSIHHLRRTSIFLGLLLCTMAYGQRVIRVSTTRDLVRNIASDRTILLEAGEYYLLAPFGSRLPPM